MTNSVEITCRSNEVYGAMVLIRRLAFIAACSTLLAATTSLQAQTSATLNVTARVVEQCTISAKAKRALAKRARRTGRPAILRKCSKGVVSRLNQRSVTAADLQPVSPLPPRLRKTRTIKKRSSGRSDVVLVTVTY